MKFNRFSTHLPGLILGLIAFLIVIPINIIDPSNIGWLGLKNDTKTYFLGWDFFRKSDWQLPLSWSPNYGMEIAGSVFMADTVPLFAIFFKLIDPFLSPIFQYHGIWLLLCFILQGILGWKISELISKNSIHRIAITALLIFQTPFLYRAMVHLPLMAHFLILGSLIICLKKQELSNKWWFFIIPVATCINAYILVMCMALWFSDFVRRYFSTNKSKALLMEFLLIFALVLFFAWQVGYFSVGGGVKSPGNPYGIYRFDLLSPIDSNGWSWILKDIPSEHGEGEGFAFLGLGYLFLVLAAFFAFLQPSNMGKHMPIPGNVFLLVVLAILILYAITNHVSIGKWNLVIPLPDAFSKITSTFRGAGRFVWPTLYFGLVVVTFVICTRYPSRSAAGILGFAAILQIADTSAGWLPLKHIARNAQASAWNTPLKDPFWQEASKIYTSVRRIPADNVTPHWATFADYANVHGMTTDSIYLARVNPVALEELNARNQVRLSTGDYDPKTLYIVSNHVAGAAIAGFKHDVDVLAVIDQHIVIAPRWQTLGKRVLPPLTEANYLPPPTAGSRYDMTSLQANGVRSLVHGWNAQFGSAGVWSSGASSSLAFPLHNVDFKQIELVGRPLLSPARPSMALRVRINGAPERSMTLSGAQPNIKLTLTADEVAAMTRDHRLNITLTYVDPTTPKALGFNQDERVLSYSLQHVRFQ